MKQDVCVCVFTKLDIIFLDYSTTTYDHYHYGNNGQSLLIK